MDVKLAPPYKTSNSRGEDKERSLGCKDARPSAESKLKESYVPPKQVRELRDLTRLRKSLIEDRTRIKNRVHAILSRNGVFDYPNPFTKKGRGYIETLELSETDRKLLEINLSIIDKINEEIKEIEKIIQEKAKIDGDVLLLTTIQISYYSALLINGNRRH